MTLSDLLADYCARTSPKPNTAVLYELAIRQFNRTLLRPATVDDLTEENMARHVSRRQSRERAPGTIAGEQRKLYALWRFACREGRLKIWPTSHPIRVPERIPRAWTVDELGKLFSCAKFATDVAQVDGPLWWGVLFRCLWETGERIGAMLQLRWEWVDLEGQTLYLPAEVRKGGHGDRLYPISHETAALLAKLPQEFRPFFWPYHPVTLYNRLKAMLTKGGLPADRRSKFHRMRRSTASHYKAAGGDVMELMGWTSAKVARGYIDPRIFKPTSAVDLLPKAGTQDGSSNEGKDSS